MKDPQLKKLYKEKVIKELQKEFNLKNIMQVPHIEKITLNMGIGDAATNAKAIDTAVYTLSMMTGQHPVLTRAKHSIAGFKLREGAPIGCKVTLRGRRMYEFLFRLVSIALPRVRDFRGLSRKAFDGNGNYTLGIVEQIVFPEINYDKIDHIRGLNITITTNTADDELALSLLSKLGVPFKSSRNQ